MVIEEARRRVNVRYVRCQEDVHRVELRLVAMGFVLHPVSSSTDPHSRLEKGRKKPWNIPDFEFHLAGLIEVGPSVDAFGDLFVRSVDKPT